MKRIIYIVLLLLSLLSISFAQKDSVNLSVNLIQRNLPFGLKAKLPACEPKISLALSGGGSRAVIALGVLKALEENNIPLDNIVGTSMGSIIGGLYASGYSIHQLDSIITSIDWDQFYTANEINRKELYLDQKITEDEAILTLNINGLTPVFPTSFNSGNLFQSFLNYYTLNAPINNYDSFDDLLFRFRAVSTNLTDGKMVELKKGSLSRALRASSSVTFLLEPVEIDSMLLVDGGLVANVPVQAAKNLGSDYIIAVDATSQLRSKDDLNTPLKIADQIVSIPMKLVTKQNIKMADVVVSPKLGNIRNDDFSSLDSLIKIGYLSTIQKLPTIKKEINQIKKNNSCDSLIYFNNLIPYNKSSVIERKLLNKIDDVKKVSNTEILLILSELYESGKFSKISADLFSQNDTTKIRINYTLKPLIKNIKINGVPEDRYLKVLEVLSPLYETPFCQKKIVRNLTDLLSYYRNIGYPFAEIRKVTFDKSSNTLLILLNEGYVNEIIISGNKRSRTELIKRELDITKDEILTSKKLATTLKNLRTTGLFKSIDINIHKIDSTNILTINVEDKLTGVARIGMKIDNERYLQPSIDIRNENLFGTGTELGVQFFGGIRNQLFLIEHKANRIFNTYLTYKIKGYYDSKDIYTYQDAVFNNLNSFARERTGEYRQILFGSSIGVGVQAGKFGNIIAEFKYEQNKIYNLTGSVVNPYTMNIAALKFSMSIDTQNKYPYPTSGTLFNTYYETSQKFLGADESYVKYALNYKGYFSVSKSATIIPRFEIGFADETLPLSQQFSFGGQFSFWGYREYEYRGRQIIIGSLAYRYKLPVKLWFDTYISARYNIGSIWEHKEEMQLKNFKHAVGFMASWDTPVGPADVGVGRSFTIDRSLDKIVVKGDFLLYFAVGYFF